MDNVKDIICLDGLKTTLKAVKDYANLNLDSLGKRLTDIQEIIPSPCVCEMTSEDSFFEMIVRQFMGDSDIPKLSTINSIYGFYPENSLDVFVTTTGNNDMVVETGVMAYTGFNAKDATVEICKDGIKIPNTISNNERYEASKVIDEGNGIACVPYAVIQAGKAKKTIYGDTVYYKTAMETIDAIKEPKHSLIAEMHQLPERNNGFFRFSAYGQSTAYDDWDATHNNHHVDIDSGYMINSTSASGLYHCYPFDNMGLGYFLFDIMNVGNDIPYYYQFIWYDKEKEGYITDIDSDAVLIKGPIHHLTFQVLYAMHYEYNGFEIEKEDTEGRAFVGRSWYQLGYRCLDKNTVELFTMGDVHDYNGDKISKPNARIFYINDNEVDDPYSLFPTECLQVPDSDLIHLLGSEKMINRTKGNGVYVGAMLSWYCSVDGIFNIHKPNTPFNSYTAEQLKNKTIDFWKLQQGTFVVSTILSKLYAAFEPYVTNNWENPEYDWLNWEEIPLYVWEQVVNLNLDIYLYEPPNSIISDNIYLTTKLLHIKAEDFDNLNQCLNPYEPASWQCAVLIDGPTNPEHLRVNLQSENNVFRNSSYMDILHDIDYHIEKAPFDQGWLLFTAYDGDETITEDNATLDTYYQYCHSNGSDLYNFDITISNNLTAVAFRYYIYLGNEKWGYGPLYKFTVDEIRSRNTYDGNGNLISINPLRIENGERIN